MSSHIASAIDDFSSIISSTTSFNDSVVAAPTAIKLSNGGLGELDEFEGTFPFLEESAALGSTSSSSSAESSFAGSPSSCGIFTDPLIASSTENASSDFTSSLQSTNGTDIDLEKQQQHHLQQFLYYQNLAIQRQEAVAKQLAQQQQQQQQEADIILLGATSTSDPSIPSLSPPSTPPTASSPDVASLSSAINSMQSYSYNLSGDVSTPNTKMDSFPSGGQTAPGITSCWRMNHRLDIPSLAATRLRPRWTATACTTGTRLLWDPEIRSTVFHITMANPCNVTIQSYNWIRMVSVVFPCR
jgi:hypothetical protein